MWNPFKKDTIIKEVESLANRNLYEFIGHDLPILNVEKYDYINRIWKHVGAVYECTDLIQKKVAKCPIVFYQVKSTSKLKQYKSLTDKSSVKAQILKAQALTEVDPKEELQKLVNNPNPQQNLANFLGIFVLSYLITGNAYSYKNISKITKRPIELWAFPDLTIRGGGIYKPVDRYYQFPGSSYEAEYPAETIYHAKTPNICFDQFGTQMYGVSPLRAYLEPLRTIEEANKQASKQMRNGGVLGMLFPSAKEDGLTADQRTAFMNKLKEGLKSNQEFSRFMTSNIPMDFKQVGLASGDLKLLDIKAANEEAIYRCYNVPLQFHNQKASTENNQNTAVKQLIVNAVAPMCDILSDLFTNFVGVHFDNTIIEFDYTQLEDMSGNMKEVADLIIPLVEKGIISRDEARFALRYGATELDYMNEFWYNDKPLSKLYNDNNNNDNQLV